MPLVPPFATPSTLPFMRALPLLSVALLTELAAAQTPTALLREGDALPGSLVVTGINNTAVNQTAGYAATVSTTDMASTISLVWGNLGGGSGSVLRQETTIGTSEQTSIESFFGISGTAVCYSPSVNDTASGITGLDGIWVDDDIIMIEEMPASLPGEFWTFGSRGGITQDGVAYWVGGTSPTQGGSTSSRGLFVGTTAIPLLVTGQSVPGLPLPLGPSAVDFDYRVSSLGSHFISPVALDTSTTEDGAIVLDGNGLMIGGGLVREADPLPAAAGGLPGENWDNFDFVGVTESGRYFITGDSDGDVATDEFILVDGAIIVREGDTLDGFVLEGSIEGAFMNEAGDLAFVWDVDDAGTNKEALYLNGELLLLEGEAVDWDGDGSVDVGTALTDFTGISALTLAANGTVYFTADVDVNGTILEGYFCLSTGVGVNYCVANANSTGMAASISANGSSAAAANNVTLMATGLPTNQFAYFVNSQTQGFVPNVGGSQGNLCLSGSIGRYNAQVFSSGPAGAGELVLDLDNTPTPLGNVAVMAGQTWNFQCWFLDANPTPTSNLTDGLSILFN